ncbi:MAG: SDR family NAD(P)-dependent oxidoreductase, partial [Thauera sp.]|nr:SDR family NAD(P)-dependent oxidoreductase [Thauera sp.]
MRLEGKTAVVTGGASGIGRATAETLAAAGAHVVIGDLDQDKGATVAAAIRDGGGKASYFSLDVTSQDSVGAFARSVETQGLEVDIVVNVAGWGKIQPFMENSPDFWRKVIDLNLLGPVLV